MENKKEKFYVSHTKLSTYKLCPMQYFYKYVLKLEKKVSRRSLYVGEDIHKLVEQFYLHKTPELLNKRLEAYNNHLDVEPVNPNSTDPVENAYFLENYPKWQEKAKELYHDTLTWRDYLLKVIDPRVAAEGDGVKNEIGYNYVHDLIKIMGQYEYYYSNDNLRVLSLEHKKYSDLGEYNDKFVVLSYITDMIVEVNGEQWLVEHKSFKDNPMSFEETWLNVQAAQYVTELNRNEGYNIVGVIWDNIKSVPPKDPNILKNGTYGKHYGTHSLFSLIGTEVIMQGPEAVIEEVARVWNEASAIEVINNYSGFLTRHTTKFNDNAVKAICKDSSEVINVITKPDCPYFRNMGWGSCTSCPFKDVCQMEMLGQDSTELINTLYTKGE